MANILLVNPYIHDFSAYDFWLKPLGILYISSFLKEAGYQVEIIDLLDRYSPHHPPTHEGTYGRGKFYNEEIEKPTLIEEIPRRFKRYGIPKENFIKILKKVDRPDTVVITSMMTYWYTGVRETVEIIKEVWGSVDMVVGGVYVTLMPEHAERNIPARVLPGNEKILFDYLQEKYGKKVEVREFSYFPMPDYSQYSRLGYISILGSRGCIFNCSYCATPRMWRFEYKSKKKIIEEIEFLTEKHKIKDVAFFDDALLFHPEIKEILSSLSSLNMRFHTPNGVHVNAIDEEMSELLYGAGFKTLYLSIESVSEEFFKRTGSKVRVKGLKKIIDLLFKAGFKYGELHAYILAGLPWQSVEDVKRTIDFSIDVGLVPHISEFTPVPGTYEYKRGEFHKYDPLLLNNTLFPGWGYEKGEIIKRYLRERLKDMKD